MRFIPIREAAAQCGQSVVAFQSWLRRMQAKHPEFPINRVRGRIEEGSLEALLRLAVEDARGETVAKEVAER